MTDPITVWYLAHPVGAADRAGVAANLARAGRWLAWLLAHEPDTAVTAPWLATMLAGVQDDCNPEHRARGMRDNLAVASAMDGIVLVGGRISSGMQSELDAVTAAGGCVSDLTWLGEEPPTDAEWASHFVDEVLGIDEEQAATVQPIAVGMIRWESP